MGISAPGDRVLVLCARARDSRVTRDFLRASGVPADTCPHADHLFESILSNQLGAGIIAEEALDATQVATLARTLGEQPPWADLPLVLLTGRTGAACDRAMAALGGNVTALERPVRRAMLITAVKSALRARGRQYEMRDMLGRMADIDRRKDEFLAMLGHELRNPLAAIQNALYVVNLAGGALGVGGNGNGDGDGNGNGSAGAGVGGPARALAVIERQTGHLTRLVDDMLDVSRVTLGKINVERRPVDLRDVATRCTLALQSEVDAQRHHLRLSAPTTPVMVEGDVVRLEQVLSNLVTNAIKYTPPGGEIEVRVGSDGGQAVIAVTDNGVGIDAANLPRVFEMFSQASQSLDRSRGGLGLGLCLVKSLVDRHNGSVQAHSDGIGLGTRFTVRLPLAHTTPQMVRAAVRAPPRRAVMHYILIIEDNEDSRETLREILEMWGHTVVVAVDGLSGLQIALENQPDVALIDIGLPKLDGYAVAREIRASGPAHKQPRLIAMTGYGQPDDQRRAMEVGFDHHLVKPIQPEALLRALTESERAQSAHEQVARGVHDQ